MAFRHPTFAPPRHLTIPIDTQPGLTPNIPQPQRDIEESQEWILFSPSQAPSTAACTQTTSTERTPATAGLSRISDIGSLDTAARAGQPQSSVLDEGVTEDGELDSLDEGLHAFREPFMYRSAPSQSPAAVLPTHDGLGTFPASSSLVQEQLWQHEQHNPKRKFDGHHYRRSSVHRRLETIEELESQAEHDKRLRIEKWRIEQSQAFLGEIEKETRRRRRRESCRENVIKRNDSTTAEDILGATPEQGGTLTPLQQSDEVEPFWRRITRRFIRDVIGIDEPLLSVILGESLAADGQDDSSSTSALPTIAERPSEAFDLGSLDNASWRDRLLRRIARELGVFADHFSSHSAAFNTYLSLGSYNDYAGIPVPILAHSASTLQEPEINGERPSNLGSGLTPVFLPTVQDSTHDASWGLEDDSVRSTSTRTEDRERLRREREYWERDLDVKMVYRFLKSRFTTNTSTRHWSQSHQNSSSAQDSARRAAIIREHHPLVARAHQSSARLRRESRAQNKRPGSSCASASVKSSRKASLVRSGGSSRNYWDIGGSVGSGSIVASGGTMGAWGEV